MHIIVGFLAQAVLTLALFFTTYSIFNKPFLSILLTAPFSIFFAVMMGSYFSKTLRKKQKDVIDESLSSIAIAQDSELLSAANANISQLAEKVSTIANMLGHASGYMDTLTHQTEVNTKDITKAIDQVVSGTSQENESIQLVAHQLEMMATATEGIAIGAQDQAKSVGNATEISHTVNKAIEEIAVKASNAAKASAQAAEAANEGGKTINATVKAISNIREKVGQSAEKVREMGTRSEEISIIVEKIKDIASQTNLLALNAAIEAARAGEMGRGFAVVASEVRKLAENSVIATKDVNNLVLAIQKSAHEAVTTMDMGVDEVQNGVELAEQSGKALETIISTSDTVHQELKDVVSLTNQQITLSRELGNAMESVSAVVEENSASSEEMSAEADNIAKEIENIAEISAKNSVTAIGVSKLTTEICTLVADSTASAQTLAEMASSLQNLVSAYDNSVSEIVIPTKMYTSHLKPTVGIIIPKNIAFWETAIKFAQKGADELGAKLIVCDSEENPVIMENHITNLVNQKVDGILWVPYFGLGRKGLTLAKNAGIPVLLIDSYEGGLQPQSEEFPNYLAFVGPADETGAYEMGNYLLNHLSPSKEGKKFIASLDGTEGAPGAIIRHKGLIRAMKEHPEAVLISSKTANFDFETAKICMQEMLNESPQIQGVWAAGDAMAQGGIEGAKLAGRHPGKDIFFVGMDLDSESLKALRNGEQLFDVGGHWLQFGFGLSILYDSLNGYPMPKGRSIVKLPLLPVTREKVDQFEKDFPNGIPLYDFKQKSRAYNPNAPVSFFEMKYSTE